MKRIFIAVKIEPGKILSSMISTLKKGLENENIKWTDPSGIHVTLAFLGNTEEEIVEQLGLKLKEKCGGSGKFEIVLRGAGLFKNLNDPRVIWTGIDPSPQLGQLNEKIVLCLQDLNIKTEDRPFKPHLTLGRIKNIKDKVAFKNLTDNFSNTELQRIEVKEFIVFESILLQHGPLYKKLYVIDL